MRFLCKSALAEINVITPPPTRGGFGLRLEAGLIGRSADYAGSTRRSSCLNVFLIAIGSSMLAFTLTALHQHLQVIGELLCGHLR